MKLWCWVPNQTFLHQVVVVRYRVTKLKFSVICIVPAVPIKSVFYGRQCWYRSPGTWEALNVPNAHGRRSFSFQIWFLETNKAGQCNKRSNCRIPCHWKVAPLKIVATWPQSWRVTQGEDAKSVHGYVATWLPGYVATWLRSYEGT